MTLYPILAIAIFTGLTLQGAWEFTRKRGHMGVGLVLGVVGVAGVVVIFAGVRG